MGKSVNLKHYVPVKFHNSAVVTDFLDILGNDLSTIDAADKLYNIGNYLDLIDGIETQINPETCDRDKLAHLAALIGLKFFESDEVETSIMRSMVSETIDWYKVKGTYKSLKIIALTHGINATIFDMYSTYSSFNPYTEFYAIKSWWAGVEDENPAVSLFSSNINEYGDYPTGYFKSPHFGFGVQLDVVYEDGTSTHPYGYLWNAAKWASIMNYVEQTRPAHTVPHYILFLTPQTNNDGDVMIVNGDIKTKLMIDWDFNSWRFDENADTTEIADKNFDQNADTSENADISFDTSEDAFINSVTKWAINSDNKGGTPGDSDVTPIAYATAELTGTDVSVVIEAKKITYKFIVPRATILSSISEIGLFSDLREPNELIIYSIFPDITKGTESELFVEVVLNRV